MPRRARVFFEGALYHVYARVTRREGIFAERAEAEAFCSLLRQVKRREGFVVLAWCVMSNHVHLLLHSAEVPLWRSMGTLQGNFAAAFNRRHGSGPGTATPAPAPAGWWGRRWRCRRRRRRPRRCRR